jgi:ribosomal protein S18 acetylase RimI-like enzyme
MFQYRPVKADDFPIIASFPLNRTESFYMYPRGSYPLTAQQLEEAAASRKKPTVITLDHEVVGYGNLYDVTSEDCWLGNVIVSPACRGRGAGRYLVNTMIRIAREELAVNHLRLVCHNTNTSALLMYMKLGFVPFGIKVVNDPEGKEMAGILMQVNVHQPLKME